MTTVEALKGLYTALGGELTDTYSSIAGGVAVSDYVLIPDMIQAITQKVPTESGASLPTVTASDNGDVLTVVDGAWAKAAAPKELPAVTAEDNGSVLKVVDGAWDKGTDEIQA